MIASVICFSIMDICVKWLDYYPIGQVLFLRFFIGFVPIFFIIPKDKIFSFYKTTRPGLHAFRVICGSLAIIALSLEEIAKIILDENKKKNFDIYKKNYEFLKEKSLYESMKLIKSDLKKLGISHDNFFSETELVNKDLVNQAIDKLKNHADAGKGTSLT